MTSSDDAARCAIFITGAASGIGRETAQLFARRGWFVGAYDIDAAALNDLRAVMAPEDSIVETLDVTDRNAYGGALDRFQQRSGGRLDLLFGNAGVIASQPFSEMSWDTIDRILRVNLFGVLIGVHAAAPLLVATPGSLCFSTCSASAIFGSENLAVYSATKQAIKGFTEAMAIEFSRVHVRVGDVLPGIIDTGMLSPEHKPLFPSEGPWRVMPPEAVAETVWRAYHEDRVHWYVPPELKELHIQAVTEPEAMRDAFRRSNEQTPA